MKKVFSLMAVLLLPVFSYAQEKGDFAVGGMLGVTGGTSSAAYSMDGNKVKDKTPSSTQFAFSPKFSYFVIDNLELSAGLEYAMQRDFYDVTSDDKNLFTFTHIAMFTIGANYYVPVVKGLLYYTPGIEFGFGGGSINTQYAEDHTSKTKMPFAFGFSADLGKFEFKPVDRIGISLNILDLSVTYASIDTGAAGVKASATSFAAGFNYGMSVGVKYYF